MDAEPQEAPLAPVATRASPEYLSPRSLPPKPLSRREQRRRRRQRRRRGEEILAWVLVPAICLGLYWGVNAGFDVLGTSPGQVWDQLMQVKAVLQKQSGASRAQ